MTIDENNLLFPENDIIVKIVAKLRTNNKLLSVCEVLASLDEEKLCDIEQMLVTRR